MVAATFNSYPHCYWSMLTMDLAEGKNSFSVASVEN